VKDKERTIAVRSLRELSWIDSYLGSSRATKVLTALSILLGFSTFLYLTIGFLVFVSLMSGVFLFLVICCLVFVSRGAQKDIVSLAPALLSELEPAKPKTLSFLSLAFGFFSFWLIARKGNGDMYGPFELYVDLSNYLRQAVADGTELAIFQLIQAFLIIGVGYLLMILIVTVHRTGQVFYRLSRTVSLSLIEYDQLDPFGNQPLRLLLVSTAILAALTSLDIFEIGSPIAYGGWLLLTSLFFAFSFRPVLAVRNRIRESKVRELRAVRRALAGDKSALIGTDLHELGGNYSLSDLMIYEARVVGVPEWPFQGRIQNIVLYVALPPIAWILAALVERIVDAAL